MCQNVKLIKKFIIKILTKYMNQMEKNILKKKFIFDKSLEHFLD